jgi:hypothetical protein
MRELGLDVGGQRLDFFVVLDLTPNLIRVVLDDVLGGLGMGDRHLFKVFDRRLRFSERGAGFLPEIGNSDFSLLADAKEGEEALDETHGCS